MESERVSLSRSGERPVTRWRREPEPVERPQTYTERPTTAKARPQSKMERPTSRRGIKTDITEYGISRPPTSGRNSISRPPSANILQRVPTASARLQTANLSPMNSGLPRNFTQPNIMILDRPVTQQGLAGIRPSSSRGTPKLDRRIHDKRYQKQSLLIKIKDLSQDLASINTQLQRRNKERGASANGDQTTKNISSELNELHNQLIDYNSALDKIVSVSNKKEIEQEARRIKSSNDKRRVEIEKILQKRSSAEKKLEKLEKDDSDFDDDDENDQRMELIKEIEKLQSEYELLLRNRSAEKSKLEGRIGNSPTKQEAYKLFAKIFEAEERRDLLLEEQKMSFEEKEAEKMMIEIEKKIADAKQELESLDMDADETSYMFEKNKVDELNKLSRLEEQIVEKLEKISNDLDGNVDSSVLVADELEMLRTLMNQNIENRDDKSFEELKQDGIRLRGIAAKLEAIELKLKNGTNTNNKADVWNVEEEKQRDFMKELSRETDLVRRDYGKLKEKIEKNEMYRFISILEDKLSKAAVDSEIERSVIDQEDPVDNSKLAEKLFSLTTQYNTVLMNEMKLVY